MREQAAEPLYHYLDATFAASLHWLSYVKESGDALIKGMQISPHEGRILQHYVQLVRAKRILEIGTFVGYSALCMAEAIGQGGHIDTIEASPENATIAQAHFDASAYKHNITIHRGKALEVLDEICRSDTLPYDIVFIDAAKSEYQQYLEKITPYVRHGGLVIGDNTLLFGNITGAPKKTVSETARIAMQDFNATLAESEHFSGIMIPTSEGMTVGIKK